MSGAPTTFEEDDKGHIVFNYMCETTGEWGKETAEIKLLLAVMTQYLHLKEQEHKDSKEKTCAGRTTLDYLSGPKSTGSNISLLSHAVKEGYECLVKKLVKLIDASAWECSLNTVATADGKLVEQGTEEEKAKEDGEDERTREKNRLARRRRHLQAITTTQSSWIEGKVRSPCHPVLAVVRGAGAATGMRACCCLVFEWKRDRTLFPFESPASLCPASLCSALLCSVLHRSALLRSAQLRPPPLPPPPPRPAPPRPAPPIPCSFALLQHSLLTPTSTRTRRERPNCATRPSMPRSLISQPLTTPRPTTINMFPAQRR